jgi:hypothetical protein
VGSYYYLMAQLPFLIYEQKPPMTSGAFKELAGTILTEEDAVFMDRLAIDPAFGTAADGSVYAQSAPSTGCGFIDEWREWERSFRLNLAKHRAVKTKRESTGALEPPPYPQDAASAAQRAVSGELSPLDAELLIDKARWNAIDSLAGIDYFDRNSVYAYFLKLLLLERRHLFNVDNGLNEYKSLYAEIIESAHNSPGEPK